MTDTEEDHPIDCITDQEKEFAQNALKEFKKKNYTACLQQINKLDNRTGDFKVVHNKMVVEYFKSDLKKTENFEKNLTSLFNQFKIKPEKLDDVDHCIAQYNQAVVLFHQMQYSAALRIMDRVYKFIEPMEETLAKQVSLLAIELQFCVKQPDKALTLIKYLENQFFNNSTDTGIVGKEKVKEKEKKVQKVQTTTDPALEKLKLKLQAYKTRCYLMKHSLQQAQSELAPILKDILNIDGLFLKANIEYLKGNYQESINLLSTIPKESLKYNECGESFNVIFNNNMGLLHHAMGKHNLACHYFQTALKEDIAVSNSGKKDLNDKPLFTLGGSKYHELIYNLGIALLHAKKPNQAFECLIIAVRRYHRNSRLWLRLAECCIMVHKESNEPDFDIQKIQKELVSAVVGTKNNRKVVLTNHVSKDKKYSTESQSYAVPVPSLEFASLCLRNAFNLLPSDTASPPVPLFLIPGVTPPAPPPSPGPAPSNPLSGDSIVALRNHILVTSAYVAICLGDFIMALEYSKLLLEQEKLSGGHKLLAHMYAAEALILMDKISEALDFLNPEKIKDIEFEIPANDEDEASIKTAPPQKWCPSSLSNAQIVLQYNIAVAKTIRGQLDQAGNLLKQIWQQRNKTTKVPAHIIMLVIYIELQLGHADIARNLVKQYSLQQRF